MKKILSTLAFALALAGTALADEPGYQKFGYIKDMTPVVTNAEQAMASTIHRLEDDGARSETRLRTEISAATNNLGRTLSADLKRYADTAETDAKAGAKVYTDASTNQLDRTLTAKVDSARAEAKGYADASTNKLNQALTGKIGDALQAAKDYADSVSGSTEEGSKAYTDNATNAAIRIAKDYADNATNGAVRTALTYADNATNEAVRAAKGYTDAHHDATKQDKLPFPTNEIPTTAIKNFKSAVTDVAYAKKDGITIDSARIGQGTNGQVVVSGSRNGSDSDVTIDAFDEPSVVLNKEKADGSEQSSVKIGLRGVTAYPTADPDESWTGTFPTNKAESGNLLTDASGYRRDAADAKFLDKTELPTKVGAFENDKGYVDKTVTNGLITARAASDAISSAAESLHGAITAETGTAIENATKDFITDDEANSRFFSNEAAEGLITDVQGRVSAAELAATNAAESAAAAAQSAEEANEAAGHAQQYADDAYTYSTNALRSANNAQTSANNAAQSAQDALDNSEEALNQLDGKLDKTDTYAEEINYTTQRIYWDYGTLYIVDDERKSNPGSIQFYNGNIYGYVYDPSWNYHDYYQNYSDWAYFDMMSMQRYIYYMYNNVSYYDYEFQSLREDIDYIGYNFYEWYIRPFEEEYSDHVYNENNPHNVTPYQIGAATPEDVESAITEAIDHENETFAAKVTAVGLGLNSGVAEEINEIVRRGSFYANVHYVVDDYFQNNDIIKAVKKERKDARGDFGTGWGYMLYNWTSDVRAWRLFVPQLSVSKATSAYTVGTGNDPYKFFIITNAQGYAKSARMSPYLEHPLLTDVYTLGNTRANLLRTDGKQGTNGCASVDYEIGLIEMRSATAPAENDVPLMFNVTARGIPYSGSSFNVTSEIAGGPNQSFTITKTGACRIASGTNLVYSTLMDDAPLVHWTAVYRLGNFRVASQQSGGTVTATLTYDSAVTVTFTDDALLGGSQVCGFTDSPTVSLTMTHTPNQLVQVLVPRARVADTISSHYYYDKGLGVTWSIDVTNGCFFTEIVSNENLTTSEEE